jgi:hypothetical protein
MQRKKAKQRTGVAAARPRQRTQRQSRAPIKARPVTIRFTAGHDGERWCVLINGKEAWLPPKEMNVLCLLAEARKTGQPWVHAEKHQIKQLRDLLDYALGKRGERMSLILTGGEKKYALNAEPENISFDPAFLSRPPENAFSPEFLASLSPRRRRRPPKRRK